jgi:UDP-glucose 4-epimerase
VSQAPTWQGIAPESGQGSRILVIGCGFIGTHIVSHLVAAGRHPLVLTRSPPQDPVISLLSENDLHIGNARDSEVLDEVLEGVRDVVYSAGGLLPAASEQDPELDAVLTLEPIRAVLNALKSRPGVTLTYLSSGGTVYGEPDEVPVDEDAPTRPFGAYGRLHLECEAEVMRHRSEEGLQARILRCSTVYGEYQRPDRGQGVVVTFLHHIEEGTPVELFGDGATIRDYVYAGDVARAVSDLLDRREGPPILNVGAGEGTALIDVLRLAEKQVGLKAKVVSHPERDFEVHRIVLDTTRLRSLVEFEPTPLKAGIARTQEWLTAKAEAA